MPEMTEGNKFLTGLIAGVAIGAVAAVLLAIKPGTETREIIMERASQLGGKAKDSFSSIFSKGQSEEETETSGGANDSARRSY